MWSQHPRSTEPCCSTSSWRSGGSKYWGWQRVGKVYRFWTYRNAVERFIASFGRFPEARQRRTGSGTIPRGRLPAAVGDTARLQLRILGLQETVRCQSAVIEKLKLKQAMTEQGAVANYLRQAESASVRAAQLLSETIPNTTVLFHWKEYPTTRPVLPRRPVDRASRRSPPLSGMSGRGRRVDGVV
jgi:hypothetical protein